MANPFAQPASVWISPGQKTFGSFVKRTRTRRGLSRRALSLRSGIDERQLEKIELGLSPPSYQDIKKTAVALNTPEKELLVAAGYLKDEGGM